MAELRPVSSPCKVEFQEIRQHVLHAYGVVAGDVATTVHLARLESRQRSARNAAGYSPTSRSSASDLSDGRLGRPIQPSRKKTKIIAPADPAISSNAQT